MWFINYVYKKHYGNLNSNFLIVDIPMYNFLGDAYKVTHSARATSTDAIV